jgi:lysophospholipase L1-like esterase
VTELHAVDLHDPALRYAGLASVDPTPTGVAFHRLPAWARNQIVDPAIQVVETMMSGARIELVTDATTIELDVQATMLQMDDEPIVQAAFDLVVDGEVVAGRRTDVGTVIGIERATQALDFRPGPPTTVRFDGLAPGDKRVEIWLPHAAVIELQALRLDGTVSPAPDDGARRWIHHGSSISHCVEAERPTGVWPVVAARLAGADLRSLGLAGQCQLDQFSARTIRDATADLISLKLGINLVNGDSMRERTFVPGVHGFLDTIRDGHPETPILVITPILCPAHEDHPGPTAVQDGVASFLQRPVELAVGALTLRRIRELLRQIVESRRSHGDENLHLLEGTELFGDGDVADLPDGLHPNTAGYQRMGERFHAFAFAPGGPFA